MKKFVVMYRVPVEVMEKWKKETPTEEMQKQGKELEAKMIAWLDAHKGNMADQGNPLGKNTRMTSGGAKPETNDLNFYNIVQAESVDEVVAMHKDSPHLTIPGAFLDIMEVPEIKM
jgi:hypothetical protein